LFVCFVLFFVFCWQHQTHGEQCNTARAYTNLTFFYSACTLSQQIDVFVCGAGAAPDARRAGSKVGGGVGGGVNDIITSAISGPAPRAAGQQWQCEWQCFIADGLHRLGVVDVYVGVAFRADTAAGRERNKVHL